MRNVRTRVTGSPLANSKWSREAVVAAMLLAFAGVTGVLFHRYFPFSDGALFEFGGRTIARGGTLYRDVWDNKLPGVFLANAAFQAAFGDRYLLHAVAETLVALGASLCLGAVARSLALPHAMLAAGLCAFVTCCVSAQLNTTELYASVPLVLAMLAAVGGRPILAGAAIGTACFFWIPAALTLAALAVVSPKQSLRIALGFVAAIAFGVAAFLVVFGPGQSGALVQSWFFYVGTPVTNDHRRLTAIGPLVDLARALLDSGVLLFFVALPALEIDRRVRRFGLVWLAASGLGTLVGLRFYPHYFMPSIPPLALLVATSRLRPNYALRGACGLALILTFVLTARDVAGYQVLWRDRASDISRSASVALAVRAMPTIDVADDYEPGLFLATDATLLRPTQLAGVANRRFLAALPELASGDSITPQIVFATKSETAPPNPVRTLVCEPATKPWRVFVRRDLTSRRILACPGS